MRGLTFLAIFALNATVWSLIAWWLDDWKGVEFFEWWVLFLACERFAQHALSKTRRTFL